MLTRTIVSAVGLIALATNTGAQTTSGDTENIAEIIVTARKREESVLKVPVIETIVTEETLQRYQLTNIESLSVKVPGLLMGGSVLATGPQISIRGVGTSTLDPGVEQSIALNLDGLSMTQGLAYKSSFFDVGQVEVLKGPQALFYGKNSPGGVVSIKTNDPGAELEVIARASYEFEARERRGEMIVSGPVTDTLGVRVAGMISDMDGFFRNKATAAPNLGGRTPKYDRFSDTRSSILRGTVLFTPTERFSARLKINHVKDDVQGDAAQHQLRSCPDGLGTVPPTNIPFIHPDEDCKFDRTAYYVDLDPAAFPGIRNNGTPFFDLRQTFGTLELNYETSSPIRMTSVTGLYEANLDTMINGLQSGYAAPPLAADNKFHRKEFTQEIRYDTDFHSPLNVTFGGFYQNAEVYNRITLQGNQALGLPFPPLLGLGSHLIEIESYSLFGQLRWRPVQELELAAGVRWTDEKRSDDAYNLITGTPVAVPLAEPRIKASNWSPELTATYTPNDDLTLFASLKRGYKSGSFTITTPAQPGVDNAFGDEEVQGGELGLKSRLLDRSLALNVAAFYYEYEGLQVGANQPTENGLPVLRTINAGGAEVYGLEIAADYRPRSIDGLSLHGAVNWTHARFTELDNVPCWGGQTIAEGCNRFMHPTTGLFTSQDLKGLRLVRAPDWQVSAGFDYNARIFGNKNVRLGSDALYTSRHPTALSDRRDVVMPGTTIFNANVALSGPDDKWEVALIANNIGNKIRFGNCTTSNYANGSLLGGVITGGTARGPAGIDEVVCVPKRGRELWMRIALRPF